jgi:hypothetical protein
MSTRFEPRLPHPPVFAPHTKRLLALVQLQAQRRQAQVSFLVQAVATNQMGAEFRSQPTPNKPPLQTSAITRDWTSIPQSNIRIGMRKWNSATYLIRNRHLFVDLTKILFLKAAEFAFTPHFFKI